MIGTNKRLKASFSSSPVLHSPPTPSISVHDHLPTDDGGSRLYRGRGIKGQLGYCYWGSGIGKVTAMLFAMEGASSLMVIFPRRQMPKKRVEHHGQKCYLMAADLRKKENSKAVVE